MEKIILPDSCKFISAFLTFRCSLDCSYCVNKASNKDFYRKGFSEISGEQWVKGLNKIESRKGLPVTLLGGEPGAHKDFIYIINNLKPNLEIDILTNLYWGKSGIENFISYVNPERVKRDAPYPSIRTGFFPFFCSPFL